MRYYLHCVVQADLKSIVAGALQGQIKKAVNKIAKVCAKQTIAVVLLIGDVFGEGEAADADLSALLEGELKFPVPTYFSVGEHALPAKVIERLETSDELVPNLTYLGRKATFTTSEGIRIVSIGGRLVESEQSVTQSLGKFDPLFLASDAKSLVGARSAHILLTNQWPANIARLSNIDVPDTIDKDAGAQPLAMLCQSLKPFYHFSSSPEAMWEREVFKHQGDYESLEEPKMTRFKSQGSLSKGGGWLSAYTIDTSRPPPATDSTEQPFLLGSPPRKRARPAEYEQNFEREHRGRGGGRKNKRPRFNPDDCFMCMNKADFKDYLVVSIGDESIVTAMRGSLPKQDTFPQLSSTGHAMIIPLYHAADEAQHGQRSQEELQKEFTEMNKYRKAMNKMIKAKSNGELGSVCYEVNRTGIRHFHWQVLPIPADKVRRGLVEGAFKLAREKGKYEVFQDCNADKLLGQRSDFFRVWTWAPSDSPVDRADQEASGEDGEGGVTKSMFFPIPGNASFNVNFGREVMAGLLQLEGRVNWRDAMLANEAEERSAEEADAEGLKADFAEFDFAM